MATQERVPSRRWPALVALPALLILLAIAAFATLRPAPPAPSPAPIPTAAVDATAPGPSVQAITQRVIDRLEADCPDCTVVIREPGRIFVSSADGEQSASLGLDAVVRVCQGGGDCEGMIGGFVRSTGEMLQGEHHSLQRSQVLPIVRTSDYLERAWRQQFPSSDRSTGGFITRPLAGDLVLTYAIDLPSSLRLVTSADLSSLDLDAAGLDALARKNLADLLPRDIPHEPVGDSAVHIIDAGSEYTSSLLAMHSRWATLEHVVKRPPLLVMAPCRNLLLFTGSGDPTAVKEMLATAEKMQEKESHPISMTLLAWSRDGWRVMPQ